MRYAVLPVTLSILLVACGGDGGADTPKAAFEAWKSAVSSKDLDAYWELTPPSQREKMEQDRKKEGEEESAAKMFGLTVDEVRAMSTKDLCGRMLSKLLWSNEERLKKVAAAEFISEEIDGGRARVFYRLDGVKNDLRMVQEDGKWYIPMFN